MSLANKYVLIGFMCISTQFANADTSDDSIAKACFGLSQAFYNMSETPPDSIDKEILKKIMGPNAEIATILNRAKLIGAAYACGEQSIEEWARLEKQATKIFNGDSPQSKRFLQVVECTKVRFERVGLTGHWAVTSLELCPQAKQNFKFYVRDQHEFSQSPPPLENEIPPQSIQQNSPFASKLTGTWIIDPKATENFVLNATPPSNAEKLAEWFGLAGGYWALFTYEFDGDSATMNAYRGARKFEFQLLSQQGTEIKYTLKNNTSSPAKTLSVFLLKDGNIKIVPSETPESSYLLWKRGALKTEQATQDDVMSASKTWLTSIQDIVKFLRETPEKTFERSIPIEEQDPHPALETAIRTGAIRRATQADAQAWLEADSEKYRLKNLSPPDSSYESSTLNAEVSKGNAYFVLKKFTYPLGLKNNNKAIFLIPRNVPVPDGDYGHSKIYHFYEDYFNGPSVEFTAGSPW